MGMKKCLQSSGRGTGQVVVVAVVVLLMGKQCTSRSNKETWDDGSI